MSLRSRLRFTQEPLYLMDGSAFVYRGFYAFQNMARSDGFPTNALYIVARLLLRLLREEQPRFFAFILDGKGPSFRQDLLPSYKAQRSKTPEPLAQQLGPLRELMDILGVPCIVSEGFEADDYIASLAAAHRDERPVVIVGSDKDLKQCLHERVVLWDPAAKDERLFDLPGFCEETGMEPASWPDYQALIGDSSDNIPGVPQVGPKTALGLMRDFPTLESLFSRLAAVPPKVRGKLEGQEEKVLMYRELTRLRTDVCTHLDLAALTVRAPNLELVQAFLQEYELRSLVREVASMQRTGIFVPQAGEEGAQGAPVPVQAVGRNEHPLFASAQPNAAPRPPLPWEDGPTPAADQEAAAPPAPAVAQKPAASPEKAAAAPATGEEGQTPPPPAGDASARPARTPEPASAPAPAAGCSEKPKQAPERQRSGFAPGLSPTAVQGSLFAPSSATGAQMPGATAPADLPLFAESVALIREENSLVVASGDWERLYTGDIPALARHIRAGTATVITADVKEICTRFPALWDIPVERWFDLSLAAYLLSPEDRSYSWAFLAVRWGARVGGEEAAPANHPGLLALDIYQEMRQRLQGAELLDVFHSLELPLVPVLARMEERGITVDAAAFAGFLTEVQADLERLTTRIHGHAGRVFNIRSSQQLSDVLFTVLGLPRAGKTKGGSASTSQESLEKLGNAHPIVADLLEYRKLEKLRSTYLEPLPRLADAAGRIHTTFNQFATATGRLSSSNPNLQNIPIRGPLGGRMRRCFIAAPGMKLVCADYSQIELRVLAHLSQDPALLDAFHNNEDIHARTAALIFEVPLAEVTPGQRRNAKTINFGLVYGMGAQKLGQELKISMKEAKAFMERYFSRLAKLKEFYDGIEREAQQHGYVVTMTGRRRLTPDILSRNNQLRSQARRQAINTRIQGSAADIIKLAMLRVEHDPRLRALDARLLLQIHDELLLEAPAANARAAGERLAELMRGVMPGGHPLSVPLLVDWGVGQTWDEAH